MSNTTSQQQQQDGSVGEAERTGIVDNSPDRAQQLQQQLQQPQQQYQPIQQQENPQLFLFQNNAERDEFSRYLSERHRIFSHGRVRRPAVDPAAENLHTEELIRIRHLIGILQNRTGGSDGEDEISTAPVRPQLFSRAANISDENPQEIAEFFRIHEPLAEMFPDLDLGRIFAEYGHMTTDGLASFIVENMEQMPRKKKSSTDETLVKQGGRQANNKSDSDAETGSGTGDDDYMGDLLADKMFGEMLQILRKEANNDEYQIPSEKEKELKDFLQQRFQIRSEFVKLMSRAFNWNVVPVILACFILQNGYGKLLMKATKMSDQFWETHLKPMQVNRKCVNKKRKFSQTITDAFGRFTAILEEFRERYPALICSDNMRITMDAATIPWEHPVEQMIECLVCFEEFPLSRVLFCTEILASTDFVDSVSADPGPSGLSADQISANQHAVEAEATANVTEGFSSAETSLIGAPSPPSTAQRNAGGAEDNISLAQIPESEEIATYEPETEMRTTESPFPQQMIIDDREEDEYLETDGLNNGANEETPISIEDYEDSSDRDEIIVVDQSMETEENESNSIGGCSSSSSSSGDEIQIISDNELSPSTELNEERNVASHNDNTENAHSSESQPLSQSQILPSASQPMYHSFCRECVRGSARAATTEIPLAPGGQGLCCMVSNCAHILPYSKVKNIINKELRTKLEERIMEENLGMASIQNLERCQKCNFAMEIEDPVEVNKVFDCWKCKTKTCRVCGSEWEEHFGLTCEELDVKLKRDRQSRDIEKRMNEAIVRNCPKCHTAFVKESGCNHMTCRCGLEMCYLCRKVITKKHQSHFCSCPHQRRDLKIQDWKCPDCHRTCLMFEDYRFHDQRAIDQIRVESGIQLQQQTTTSSTSTAAQAENQQTLPDLLNWDLERSRLENQLAEIRQQRRATAEAFREGQTDGVNSNRTQHQQIMAELHQRQSQLYDELFRLQRDRHRHHQRDEHIINLRYQTELLRARHIRRQIRQMENGELGTIHNQPPEELFEQFRNAISNVQLNTQLQRAITRQADELCASNPQLNSDRTVTSVPNFSLQQEHNIRGEPNRAPAEAENRQNQNFPGFKCHLNFTNYKTDYNDFPIVIIITH